MPQGLKYITGEISKSMKKKVLILDIDGTLTNSRKEITPRTLEALLDIQKCGHTVVIASGRPTHGVKWISDSLQLNKFGGYVLCFNGARITNVKTGEIVHQQIFPRECIAPLWKYAKEHDMGMVTYEEDTVIAGTRIDEHMRFEAGLNHMELKQVENFASYVDFDVNKCLFTADVDVASKLEQEMASKYEGSLSIYRSEPFLLRQCHLGWIKLHPCGIYLQGLAWTGQTRWHAGTALMISPCFSMQVWGQPWQMPRKP